MFLLFLSPRPVRRSPLSPQDRPAGHPYGPPSLSPLSNLPLPAAFHSRIIAPRGNQRLRYACQHRSLERTVGSHRCTDPVCMDGHTVTCWGLAPLLFFTNSPLKSTRRRPVGSLSPPNKNLRLYLYCTRCAAYMDQTRASGRLSAAGRRFIAPMACMSVCIHIQVVLFHPSRLQPTKRRGCPVLLALKAR